MVSDLRLSPRALADLETIFLYTAQRWSAEQAHRYVHELDAAMRIVADDPQRGHAIDDVRAGYRRSVAGSHLIVYRPDAEGIEVMRILHRRMDLKRHV